MCSRAQRRSEHPSPSAASSAFGTAPPAPPFTCQDAGGHAAKPHECDQVGVPQPVHHRGLLKQLLQGPLRQFQLRGRGLGRGPCRRRRAARVRQAAG